MITLNINRLKFNEMVTDHIRRGAQQISFTKDHKIKYNYTNDEIREDAQYWLKNYFEVNHNLTLEFN